MALKIIHLFFSLTGCFRSFNACMILSGSCNFSTILCSITFEIGFLSHWLWSEIRYWLTVFYVDYVEIQKGPSMFVFISFSNTIWESSKSLEGILLTLASDELLDDKNVGAKISMFSYLKK